MTRNRVRNTLGLLLIVVAAGCRIQSVESMHASSAPNPPAPGTADPYTFGGIADGTGGAVVATTQTMETENFSGPKFKQIAGKEGFTSMTGHRISPAKESEVSGDYQPLPHEEAMPENGENHESH